jgi:hypothetical protein
MRIGFHGMRRLSTSTCASRFPLPIFQNYWTLGLLCGIRTAGKYCSSLALGAAEYQSGRRCARSYFAATISFANTAGRNKRRFIAITLYLFRVAARMMNQT